MPGMSRTADVVVIGGGAMGTSAAYHLAAAGAGRVLLLERDPALGLESTGKCAGGFRQQFGSEVNIRLSQASVPMILAFAETHGLPLDVHQDGYLFVCREDATWASYRAAAEMQRSLGVDVRLLAPEEALAMVPGLAIDDVVGATFGPADGIADPSGLTNGYATAARRAGATIEMGVAVTAIRSDSGRITGVETANGSIDSPVVVLAAGVWSPSLARTAGVHLPVEPLPRHVAVTGPFVRRPDRRTLVIDAETAFYFHREGDGVLMGMPAAGETASWDTRVDDGFIADQLLPAAVSFFPPLESAGLASAWVGLYEMTPDRHAILGPVDGVDGLQLAVGFSGHGFQHAPIVGTLLAEEVVDGRAHSVDVSSLRLERFARGQPIVESHVV
jgi:sarcosine oxidase subunit beta